MVVGSSVVVVIGIVVVDVDVTESIVSMLPVFFNQVLDIFGKWNNKIFSIVSNSFDSFYITIPIMLYSSNASISLNEFS